MTPAPFFRHVLTSANESNAFVVACAETREAILIDMGAFEPEIAEFVRDNDLGVKFLFITHDHYDHTGGLHEAVARFGCEVLAGHCRVAGHPARRVGHGEVIRVGRLTGTVLATPGHTPEALGLALAGMVFTGDALFAGSVGGTASAASARQQLDAIRAHIFALLPETEIHTGHGPSSTVAVESRCNPFFA